jgi:hypothetical protein
MSMKKAPQSYTIGRHAFAKISAVEGIRLKGEVKNIKDGPRSA